MADSSAATGSTVTAVAAAATTTTTTQAAVPLAAAQQKLSESDDFTDNSAENTKEANQEDTSQQSGLATVESEYDTASDSPSDGEEGQEVEESGVDEEDEGEEDGDEESSSGTDDEGEDEGEEDDDVIEVLDYERQSGDGQEQDAESRRKVDDDEDRSNPQYIPKKGTFYEHDDRTAETDTDERGGMDGDDQPGGRSKRDDELDDGGGGGGGDHHGGGGSGSGSGGGAAGAIGGGGGGGGAGGYSVGERRGSEKGGAGALKGRKKWQASTDRWTHDRFDESEQAPKSRAELVSAYGYDIRSEDGPPKARRKRRYARGPNQYTRNWEDEDAYQKSSNVEHQRHKKVPRPEEFPELGPKSSAGGGARGAGGAGRSRVAQKNATPRQAAGELGVAGRTGRPGVRAERVRSGDWAAERDRDKDQADNEYGATVEYGSGGEGLRYRNEEQRPNARNNYHNNKENKQGGVRNGGKEKDGYSKVINSLQFKNQTRIKPTEGGGAAQGPGAASVVDGAVRGGAPVLHSNSAGALSGSSNSNKMNNSGPTPPTGNSSNTSIDRVEPQAARASVSTSASLGSVPSSGTQHYGHVPSMVQMQQQQPPLQHQQQQPAQQSSQSHSQSLKSQGYHEEDHPKYGAMYGGAGLDHDGGPVRMQSKDRQLLASVSGGANVVPLASAPSGGHNQRSQVSPRAIVAQTSPTVPQQSQPITMQMQYQQQPPGVAYGVTPQGPIPTHSLQQLQHQQQQQLLTSEPVVNRSKRYSSQRQRSQLENMNLAMQQSSLHDHQQVQQQQQLLQHQQMLQHQHQQEQMQQNKHKQSYQQPPQQQQQQQQQQLQQQQPQPIPPQALPQSAAGGGAGGLPMTLQQTGDYHLQQNAVAAKSQPQPPPQPAGPPPPPQYHQAPTVYYTSAAPTNVPPGPGDYVTTVPPVAGPPPPQVQAPPPQQQPQYVPPPYATQGPPSQGGYLAGPPVAPPASAYLPPPPQASPAVVGPPQAPPGGPVPNYVPALGPPPPTAPVNSGQYPATAYAGFQPGYNPAVPQGVVTGAPPPPVVAPGATGPPPPAALYQPAGGITYYAPQTQAQAPRPLPTGRRPTAAIPILAPPDRKPVPAPAPGNAQSKAPNAASVGSNRTDGGDGGMETPATGVGEADSGENIDHILDNMFVQRPPYQPPSRKSPSPALQSSVVAAPGSGAPPSMMGSEGNANGATELRHDPEADKKVMDGGGGGATQELVDTIGDSVKKLSLQDEMLSHGASLADGNNETNPSAVAGASDAVGSHTADD